MANSRTPNAIPASITAQLKCISLCTFVKNEAHCIEHMIKSVAPYVHEFIAVDTGSTDNTVQICKKYTQRVYEVGFTDFGKIRTVASHLARMPWVLMLDADETLSHPEELQKLVGHIYQKPEAYAFPRARWLDLEMTQQTEVEAYPDYQVRLYRNQTNFVWQRALHEFFHGGTVEHLPENGLLRINHFQDVFKDEEANRKRDELYETLAKQANVSKHGGKSLSTD